MSSTCWWESENNFYMLNHEIIPVPTDTHQHRAKADLSLLTSSPSSWDWAEDNRIWFYNPNSGNVGMFFNLNERKTKRLSNHMNQYYIHNIQREHKTFLKGEMLHLDLNKWAHFKFNVCYRSQESCHRGNKKARHFEKIQLGEHLSTN